MFESQYEGAIWRFASSAETNDQAAPAARIATNGTKNPALRRPRFREAGDAAVRGILKTPPVAERLPSA